MPTSRLIILAFVSVVLMMLDHRTEHLEPIRAVLSILIYPLQYAVDIPTAGRLWTSKHLVSRDQLIQERDTLAAQLQRLKLETQKLNALRQENSRLRALLASADQIGDDQVLVAELLAVNMDPYRQQVVLNKGGRKGVYIGQPLLDASGVMGQIIHVNAFSATAILISDPNHAIPVQINRNGLRTLAMGTGNTNALQLSHVPTNGDIKVGDRIITSGLGERFPADYPVGEVINIERPAGKPFAEIEIRPTAHLNRSREVLLLWPTQKPPILSDLKTADPKPE